MFAIYVCLLLIYLWGIVICYNACQGDEEFVTAFVNLPATGAWIVFGIMLLLWPLMVVVYLVGKIFKRESN